MHREMRFQAVTTSATESVLGEWGEVRPTLLNTSMVSRSLLEFVRVHPRQREASGARSFISLTRLSPSITKESTWALPT